MPIVCWHDFICNTFALKGFFPNITSTYYKINLNAHYKLVGSSINFLDTINEPWFFKCQSKMVETPYFLERNFVRLFKGDICILRRYILDLSVMLLDN